MEGLLEWHECWAESVRALAAAVDQPGAGPNQRKQGDHPVRRRLLAFDVGFTLSGQFCIVFHCLLEYMIVMFEAHRCARPLLSHTYRCSSLDRQNPGRPKVMSCIDSSKPRSQKGL
jgi:hypothetical protein